MAQSEQPAQEGWRVDKGRNVGWTVSKHTEDAYTEFLIYFEAEAHALATLLDALEARAETAEAERDAFRAALMSIGCEYAIPCVDMRAFYKPEHVFCTRCAALSTPAASEEEGVC